MKITKTQLKQLIKEELTLQEMDPFTLGIAGGVVAAIATPIVLRLIGSVVSKTGHKVLDYLENKKLDDLKKEIASHQLLMKTLPKELMTNPEIAEAMSAYIKLGRGKKLDSDERTKIINAINEALPEPNRKVAISVFNDMLKLAK